MNFASYEFLLAAAFCGSLIGIVVLWRRASTLAAKRIGNSQRRGLLGRHYGVLLTLICLAFITSLVFINIHEWKQVVEKFRDEEIYDANLAAKQLEHTIGIIRAQVRVLIQNPNIINLNDSGKGTLKDFYELSDKSCVRAISRVSPDMRLLYTTPSESFIGADLSSQAHHRRMAKAHQELVSSPFQAVQGYRAVALLEPVFEGNRFMGSVGILIDFNQLANECLSPAKTGNISTAGILDMEGRVLASTEHGDIGKSILELGKNKKVGAKLLQKMRLDEKGWGSYMPDWEPKFSTTLPARKIGAFSKIHLTDQDRWIFCVSAWEYEILNQQPIIRWADIIIVSMFFVLIILASIERLRREYRYSGVLEQEIEDRLTDLRRSENLFHQIFDQSAVASLLVDKTGHCLNANQAYSRIFGIPLERLKSAYNILEDQGWEEAGAGPSFHAALEGTAGAIETSYLIGHQEPFADLPPRVVQIDGHITPIFDDQGHVASILISLVDIAERKKAQRLLQKINRALLTLSSCNKALVHAEDMAELLRENCRILTEMGGYRLAWIGLVTDKTQPESVRPYAQAGFDDGYLKTIQAAWESAGPQANPLSAAIRSRQACVVQDLMAYPMIESWRAEALRRGFASMIILPLLSSDGVLGTLSVYSSETNAFDREEVKLLEELAGDLSYGILALQTRAERLHAEQARMLLATAVEQAAEGIFITDTSGIIQYVNPAFINMTGFTAEEAIDQKPRIFKSGRHDKEFYRNLWETLAGGQVWTGHIVNRRNDGSTYEIESMISPVRDPQGRIHHYVAVNRDVTQELVMESQLRQAQKMEAIGKLAGGIAHDFNNVLTGVMGNLEISQRLASENIRKYLADAVQACLRASELVRQLLTFARKTPGVKALIEINGVVQEATRLIEKTFDKRIEVNIHHVTRMPLVIADPTQIHQVIMNLCVNARDAIMPLLNGQEAMGDKRSYAVNIETYEMRTNAEYCRVHTYAREGLFVVMAVSDNGIGMDGETQARIFDPFFTTKELGKGTGLGLATVYGIVKSHNGWIQVSSKPGEGTTFKVFIPVNEPPDAMDLEFEDDPFGPVVQPEADPDGQLSHV